VSGRARLGNGRGVEAAGRCEQLLEELAPLVGLGHLQQAPHVAQHLGHLGYLLLARLTQRLQLLYLGLQAAEGGVAQVHLRAGKGDGGDGVPKFC